MLLHSPHYQFNSLLFGFLCCLHTENKFTAVVEWFAISLCRFVLQVLEYKNNFCTIHCNLEIIKASFIRTSKGWTKNLVAHVFILVSALAYVALTLFSCITFSWCSIFKSDSLHKQLLIHNRESGMKGGSGNGQWEQPSSALLVIKITWIFQWISCALDMLNIKQVCILNAEPRYCKGSMKKMESLYFQVTSSNHK